VREQYGRRKEPCAIAFLGPAVPEADLHPAGHPGIAGRFGGVQGVPVAEMFHGTNVLLDSPRTREPDEPRIRCRLKAGAVPVRQLGWYRDPRD
jgi:hypothetical protein